MIDTWADPSEACAGRLWGEGGPDREGAPLSSWLLTTRDAFVAQAVAEVFRVDGPRRHRDEDGFEVVLGCDTVTVVVATADSVLNRMVAGDGSSVPHICDGERFVEPDASAARPCSCPGALSDRKAKGRSGAGPTPDCRLVFQLAAQPELGSFCFLSRSWELALSLRSLHEEVGSRAPIVVDLTRRTSSMTTRSGMEVAFTTLVATAGREQRSLGLAV
ncbi:hypothetical protein [Streptomyces buecherae]|uniref:hypothetical protein n=1 Tax=Streptomyces buecherae TaxID=2763006 RepID=UPI0037980B31